MEETSDDPSYTPDAYESEVAELRAALGPPVLVLKSLRQLTHVLEYVTQDASLSQEQRDRLSTLGSDAERMLSDLEDLFNEG